MVRVDAIKEFSSSQEHSKLCRPESVKKGIIETFHAHPYLTAGVIASLALIAFFKMDFFEIQKWSPDPDIEPTYTCGSCSLIEPISLRSWNKQLFNGSYLCRKCDIILTRGVKAAWELGWKISGNELVLN